METILQIADIPALGSEDIHIWGAEVSASVHQLERLERVLCREEREKAARYVREADRKASILARGALRILLSAYSGERADEITFHYSENGKPSVVPQGSGSSPDQEDAAGGRDPIGFNVSHSGNWVVLAFGRSRQVGVDLEEVRRDMDVMSIASRYFAPEETERIAAAADPHQLFFHHWARKEAYVKAAGSGLFRELSSFSVPVEDGEKDGWYFQRLEAGHSYASAVVTDKPMVNVPCFDFGGLNWDS